METVPKKKKKSLQIDPVVSLLKLSYLFSSNKHMDRVSAPDKVEFWLKKSDPENALR